jgi:hypothetical protein
MKQPELVSGVARALTGVLSGVVFACVFACAVPQRAAGGPTGFPQGYNNGYGTEAASYVATRPGPWVRQRLGYTALTYEVPSAPEVLFVESQHSSEIARVAMDSLRVLYEVRSFTHAEGAEHSFEQLLTDAIDEEVTQTGSFVRLRATANSGNYPGVALQIESPRTGTNLNARVLVGRERSYIAMVVYPTAAGLSIRNDITHFLSSLTLDEGDAPDPLGDGTITEAPQLIQPVGALFAVQIPGRPLRTQSMLTTPQGDLPTVTYACQNQNATERWEVSVTQFSSHAPAHALDLVVAPLLAAGWVSQEHHPETNRGFAGNAYVLTSDNNTRTTHLRVFVTENRLYTARVTLPSTSVASRETLMRSFFSSLRIL